MAGVPSSYKGKIETAYDELSPIYDQTQGTWMKYSAKMILSELRLPDNPVCLDVACGTGLSTFQLAEVCGGKGIIYGADISQKMLDQAESARNRLGLGNVRFLKMDAENLEFPDSVFDIVLSNMSLTHFPDKHRALSEMYRVLKPAGQFCLVYHGRPMHREAHEVARQVASRHPELPSFTKMVEDMFAGYSLDLEDSINLLNQTGFAIANIYGRHSFTWMNPSSMNSEQSAFWALYRQALPLEVREQIGLELVEAARRAAGEKGLKVTNYIVFAWGKKPS